MSRLTLRWQYRWETGLAPLANAARTRSYGGAKGETERQVLRRALGITGDGTLGNRNHIVTRPGSKDHGTCLALVKQGHMLRIAGSAYNGWVDVFVVTDSGRMLGQRSAL